RGGAGRFRNNLGLRNNKRPPTAAKGPGSPPRDPGPAPVFRLPRPPPALNLGPAGTPTNPRIVPRDRTLGGPGFVTDVARRLRHAPVTLPDVTTATNGVPQLEGSGGGGSLGARMGVVILEASPERVVGTMPVEG